MKKRKRMIITTFALLAFLLSGYLVASLLAVETIEADNVNVIEYEETNDVAKIKVGFGLSNRVLAYSKYRTENNKLYITVKEGPLWGLYFNHLATMTISVPLKNKSGEKYQYYFEDENHIEEIVIE